MAEQVGPARPNSARRHRARQGRELAETNRLDRLAGQPRPVLGSRRFRRSYAVAVERGGADLSGARSWGGLERHRLVPPHVLLQALFGIRGLVFGSLEHALRL